MSDNSKDEACMRDKPILPEMTNVLERQELRQQLIEIIFRERTRPPVQELLRIVSPKCKDVIDTPAAGIEKDGVRDHERYKDILWERVTLNLHDESDPSQTVLNLLLAKSRSLLPNKSLRTICILHGTSKSCDTEDMLDIKARFARHGFLVVGLNSRYHGCRRGDGYDGKERYLSALVQAWKRNSGICPKTNLYPFIYDTVGDLFSVADYLLSRSDVSSLHLGITGISLGGMHAWFAAAADTRWTAVAPLIGVQSFNYAVDESCFEARVGTIQDVFDAAAEDMGTGNVSGDVVRAVWNRICPGLLEQFDCEHSLGLISPRPVFIANGELDPRCPVTGLENAVLQAREVFRKECGDAARLKLSIYKNVGHEVTDEMWKDCISFFEESFDENKSKPLALFPSGRNEPI